MSQKIGAISHSEQMPSGVAQPLAQQNQPIPQELQNARPSRSVLGTIGRVVLGVGRVLIAIPTLGLSELAIRGIRSLCQRSARPANPRPPRVPKNMPAMLPHAAPHVDADNTALNRGMHKLDLPQRHLNALTELLSDLSLRYGDKVPKDIDALTKLYVHTSQDRNTPFVLLLRELVSNSTEYVDPGRLMRLAKELLEPEMARQNVGDILQEKAKEMGLQLRPGTLKLATEQFFVDLQRKSESIPMGHAKEAIVDVLNYQSMANTNMVRDAVKRMEKHVNMEDLFKRVQLQDCLNTFELPKEYQEATDAVMQELRAAFGQDFLNTDLKGLLGTKMSSGFFYMLLSKLWPRQRRRPSLSKILPKPSKLSCAP